MREAEEAFTQIRMDGRDFEYEYTVYWGPSARGGRIYQEQHCDEHIIHVYAPGDERRVEGYRMVTWLVGECLMDTETPGFREFSDWLRFRMRIGLETKALMMREGWEAVPGGLRRAHPRYPQPEYRRNFLPDWPDEMPGATLRSSPPRPLLSIPLIYAPIAPRAPKKPKPKKLAIVECGVIGRRKMRLED